MRILKRRARVSLARTYFLVDFQRGAVRNDEVVGGTWMKYLGRQAQVALHPGGQMLKEGSKLRVLQKKAEGKSKRGFQRAGKGYMTIRTGPKGKFAMLHYSSDR